MLTIVMSIESLLETMMYGYLLSVKCNNLRVPSKQCLDDSLSEENQVILREVSLSAEVYLNS